MSETKYRDLLNRFSDALKIISEDVNKTESDKYMTICKKPAVNLDKVKNDFVRKMALTAAPLSCDALYMAAQNNWFMIEFKNGIIKAKKSYEIKVKIFETLLMLLDIFSWTISFLRNNATFILVYNEEVQHGEKQFEDTGINAIKDPVFNLARMRRVRFGLHRFKKLYFKEVYTYSKKEFETEFVAKYCM
jgi:hypothetical protein